MRRFLLLAHRVPTGGQFTLNDLAGGGGRVDEVARSVSTAFTLSNDLRRDTELTVLCLNPAPPGPRRIRFLGDRLRHLNPDERSTAALIKNGLVRAIPTEHEIESSPGLLVGPVDPVAELTAFAALPGAFWLTETGSPLRGWSTPPGGFAALLSDPYNPSETEMELLRRLGLPPLSLGPRSLRASQCIDLVHGEFDLREGAPDPPTA
ncbi:MAG TPA: tRNA (pseudouridine(54)-N(1))-methyltransferase TrmY [Thermoplasmata archaeon]